MQLENLSHSQSKNGYTSKEKILSLVHLNDIKVNANVVEGVSLKCLYFYAYLNAHALICSSKPTTPKVYVVNEAERILISFLLKHSLPWNVISVTILKLMCENSISLASRFR